MQQAPFLRGREHGQRTGRAEGAKVRPLQRIDGNVDGREASLDVAATHFLADVEHGRLVALTLADDDGAVDGQLFEGLPHRLRRDAVRFPPFAITHRVRRRDRRLLHYRDDPQRQFLLFCLSHIPSCFPAPNSSSAVSLMARLVSVIRDS